MLLSVTQRTREIGVRRAVGAQAGDVLQQFLTEAVALSALGGLAGVTLGIIAAFVISSVVQWTVSISLLSVLISFSIAASVGIFFGYYPAREASRVAPMDSLRYE
jgi:ABC-type antimicrobial peptide transport system permease subunit